MQSSQHHNSRRSQSKNSSQSQIPQSKQFSSQNNMGKKRQYN